MYWDGRRKLDRNKHMLLELARYQVRPEWGTAYPCSRRNLASYRRVPVPARKKPLSNELATSKVVSFLNEPIGTGSKEEAALHRLAEGMQLEDWGPDLAIKAFDDLDVLFFRGVLATRTMINYCTQEVRQALSDYLSKICMDTRLWYETMELSSSQLLSTDGDQTLFRPSRRDADFEFG